MIRAETSDDWDSIDRVHHSAFAGFPGHGSFESDLVRTLRSNPAWLAGYSLVYEVGGKVVGHVLVSRATVDDQPALALGPIGVLSDHQRSGIGSALMNAVITRAQCENEAVIALLGDPSYYARFGFVLGSTVGIAASEEEWASHFQVLVFRPIGPGTFVYPDPFYQVG